MRRVTCTCGWSELAFTRRGAQLKQDLHDTTCSKPGIDDSGSQYLLCRHREAGCTELWRFPLGGLAQAQARRARHEKSECRYR